MLDIVIINRWIRNGYTVNRERHLGKRMLGVGNRSNLVEDGSGAVNGFEMRRVGMSHKERIGGRLARRIGEAQEEGVALEALAEGQIAHRNILGTVEENRVLASGAHREGIGKREGLLRFGFIETDAHLNDIVERAINFGARRSATHKREQQERPQRKQIAARFPFQSDSHCGQQNYD